MRKAYYAARRNFRIARKNPMNVEQFNAAVDVFRAVTGRWDMPGSPAGFLDLFQFRRKKLPKLCGPYAGFYRVFGR